MVSVCECCSVYNTVVALYCTVGVCIYSGKGYKEKEGSVGYIQKIELVESQR